MAGWLRRRLLPRAAALRFLDCCDREALLAAMARLRGFDPRTHAWRSALALSLAAGVGPALVHPLFEGLPPNLARLLLVSAFFATGKTLSALLGFALLGGLLGLRPPLISRRPPAPEVR